MADVRFILKSLRGFNAGVQRQKEKSGERLEIFGVLSFISPVIPILVKRLSFPKPTPIRGVHLQQADRRSANRTATDNKHSIAFEVLIPPVLPRMKQTDESALSGSSPLRFGPLCALQW